MRRKITAWMLIVMIIPALGFCDGSCDEFVHHWIDHKNGPVPKPLQERIQKYLGKEVIYPPPVSEKEAVYFGPHPQNGILVGFKPVPRGEAEKQDKIPAEYITDGFVAETRFGTSPVTLALDEVLTATIQNHTYFLAVYRKDDLDLQSLYLKTPGNAPEELVQSAADIEFFTLGKGSPVFAMRTGPSIDAHFYGDLYQIAASGELKELRYLSTFKESWDVYDFEGKGNPDLMTSEEVKAPSTCQGDDTCFFREMKIERWNGNQLEKVADYFYIEPCDVVR